MKLRILPLVALSIACSNSPGTGELTSSANGELADSGDVQGDADSGHSENKSKSDGEDEGGGEDEGNDGQSSNDSSELSDSEASGEDEHTQADETSDDQGTGGSETSMEESGDSITGTESTGSEDSTTDTDPDTDPASDEDSTGPVDCPEKPTSPTSCELGCPYLEACEDPIPLAADELLSMQDSATGGFDCAAAATGSGGPRLYYAVTIPAGEFLSVAVQSTRSDMNDELEPALIRIMRGCLDSEATATQRGGGRVEMCLHTPDVAQDIIVAVSQYSGKADNLSLAYDISNLRAERTDCPGELVVIE